MGEVSIHMTTAERECIWAFWGIRDRMCGRIQRVTGEALSVTQKKNCVKDSIRINRKVKGRNGGRVADDAVVCAEQRINQEGLSPSGSQMEGTISK